MEDFNSTILMQLVEALEDSVRELEAAYNRKNLRKFREIRQEILELQKRISTYTGG